MFKYSEGGSDRARKLRRSMTAEERRLWYDFLKNLPVTVNRQKPIGPYIADFYVHAANLAIELDGSQHYEEEGPEYDRRRDDYFLSLGIKVLRYPNNEARENFAGVCANIASHIPGCAFDD